jgi:hypothetical protein
MLTNQIVGRIDELLESLRDPEFLEMLKVIAEIPVTRPPVTDQLVTDAYNIVIANLRNRKLIAKAEEIETAIAAFYGYTRVQLTLDMPIIPDLHSLIRTYERFFYAVAFNDKSEVLVALINDAKGVHSAIRSVVSVLENLSIELAKISPPAPNNSEARLWLLLESELDLIRFGAKLQALQIIYNELSNLLSISTTEHPIQIRKIESGSFWADVLGYPKIIELITSLIEDAVSFMYRKFTNEGKISTIPRKVDAIDEIVQLRNKLRLMDFDTTEMDEHIEKSAVVIAAQLNELLMGEPKIVINGREFSVGDNLKQKFIEARKNLFLPSPSIGKEDSASN